MIFGSFLRRKKDKIGFFNADVLNLTNHIYYINSMIYHYRCWENSRTNKFDLNIPQLTSIELETLEGIMRKHKLQDKVDKYLKCRICTRLYTCMRLYFFMIRIDCRIVRKLIRYEV